MQFTVGPGVRAFGRQLVKHPLTSILPISATNKTIFENFGSRTYAKLKGTATADPLTTLHGRDCEDVQGTLCVSWTMALWIRQSVCEVRTGSRAGRSAQNEVAGEALRLLCHVPDKERPVTSP
jgi:hypothetical protein